MNRLLLYYKRVLNQKYLYYLVGKSLGLSLSSRIFHNWDLLRFSYARELSKLIYNKNGTPRYHDELSDEEVSRLEELISAHKLRSRCCIEYWISNGIKEVPEEYIREFIADRYADCGLDTSRFLTSNRDLFFQYDSEEVSYSSQTRDLIVSFISSRNRKS